ncbi:hypothetical protein LTR94_028374, partial [Friedmanniomyces endolithicus]
PRCDKRHQSGMGRPPGLATPYRGGRMSRRRPVAFAAEFGIIPSTRRLGGTTEDPALQPFLRRRRSRRDGTVIRLVFASGRL